jgi:hypothetical protein
MSVSPYLGINGIGSNTYSQPFQQTGGSPKIPSFSDFPPMGLPKADEALLTIKQQLDSGRVPSLNEFKRILQGVDFEPESPHAIAFQSRLAALMGGLGRKADLRLQTVFIDTALNSLDRITGSLSTINNTQDPNSPAASALNARIAAINSLKQALQIQKDRALAQDDTKGAAFRLDNPLIPNGTRAIDNQQVLRNLQRELLQGRMPSVEHLADAIQGSPESPEAQATQARMINMLETYGGKQGRTRGLQLAQVTAMRGLDNVTGALHTIAANIEPDSPQSIAIFARLSAIQAVKQQLQSLHNVTLAQDPHRGQAIGYNNQQPSPYGGQSPFGNIQNPMVLMMLLLGALLFGRQPGGAAGN